MNIYVTSDLHFGHKNIIKYENRPYKTIDDMNCDYIKLWNSKIKSEDLVYILGDFSWLKPVETTKILKQLNGRKTLIIGNHDCTFLNKSYFDSTMFEEITHYKEIKLNKQLICMCHYPIADWNGKENGSIHLYGHVHTIQNDAEKFMESQRQQGYKCFNVGIDVHKKIVNINEFLGEE